MTLFYNILYVLTIDKFCDTYGNKRTMYKIRRNYAQCPHKKFDYRRKLKICSTH